MFNNSNKPFFHPVTHQLIQPGQFYDGAAHQDHENVAAEESKEMEEQGDPSIDKDKDVTDKADGDPSTDKSISDAVVSKNTSNKTKSGGK